MCRSVDSGGRRCPSGCAGSGGCEYIDERMRHAVDPEAETQKFSQVHKEVLEEAKGKETKEELERAVGPQEFENFHRVVSKMINQSDMTDHDKMIARRKWNRAEQEVSQGQVTHVTLKTWEKMAAGTVLFLADRIGAKGRKVNWRQLNRALKASVSVREFGEGNSNEQVIPEGFDSYEEFIHALEEDEINGKDMDFDDVKTIEDHHAIKLSPEEAASSETIFDIPEETRKSRKLEAENNKEQWGGPQSFARRPKSERGAHKAGKPEAASISNENTAAQDTHTKQMPTVSVTPIPENEL